MTFHLKIFLKIVLFSALTHTLCAQSKIPYKALSTMMNLASGKKTIEKTILVPVYIKSAGDKIDHTQLKFTLSDELTKKTQKLHFEILKKLPIDSLNISDLEHLEEDYIVKLWVPLDIKAYKHWQLTHNQAKGSLQITIGTAFSSKDVLEEKRAEYREKLENQKSKDNKGK